MASEWLRFKGCGQLDIAYLQKTRGTWEFVGLEVKSGDYVSPYQKSRLYKSVDEVAKHLDVNGSLKFALRQKELLQ